MRFTEDALVEAVASLGWDVPNDDIHVEIGGTSVYGINGDGTKWAPTLGTRKYNNDAFIVIKNRSRDPIVRSQPNPDLKQQHPYQGELL